jgi:DUF1009 family protein
MSAAAQLVAAPSTLGIIAGGGELPRILIQACQEMGRNYFVLALEDAVDEETVVLAADCHAKIRLGAIGKAIDLLRKHEASEIVMAGRVTRPRIASLRPDLKGAKLLARISGQLLSGDNALLTSIVAFLEEEGFRVVGAEEVTQDLMTPEGMIGNIYPDKRAQADIETGARIARAIGALDIGQAVIIENGLTLGLEAIEGTDGLIRRCASYRREEKGGVLIKVRKPQQEKRVDLPTIGVETIQQLAAHGFAGVAIEAGASLILNRREVARQADALGIFVIGFSILE